MSAPFRVLIIDDSERDTFQTVRALRKQWPSLTFERVDCASDMELALKKEPWNCIVCDIVMPAFSAMAALQIYEQSELFWLPGWGLNNWLA
jgi:DNA-binding NtrC family response regulator